MQNMNEQTARMLQSLEERLSAQFARVEEMFNSLPTAQPELTANETPPIANLASPTFAATFESPFKQVLRPHQLVKSQLL